jgi:putative aminopeptidase FrvX
MGFGIRNSIRVLIDVKGNIYLIKGILNEGEYYPCVCAHIDTVHYTHKEMIKNNQRLNIIEDILDGNVRLSAEHPTSGKETGIGGDDKCGVAICLELLLKSEKMIAAFFVQEESGCHGSKNADDNIFNKVGYVIEFDAPKDNWCTRLCCGIQLYQDDVFNEIKPILDEFGIDNISVDPYTDVYALRTNYDFQCMNFFAGYYNYHSKYEYVLVKDVEKAINMGDKIIKKLGYEKRFF